MKPLPWSARLDVVERVLRTERVLQGVVQEPTPALVDEVARNVDWPEWAKFERAPEEVVPALRLLRRVEAIVAGPAHALLPGLLALEEELRASLKNDSP